jgi:hypothetical protein
MRKNRLVAAVLFGTFLGAWGVGNVLATGWQGRWCVLDRVVPGDATQMQCKWWKLCSGCTGGVASCKTVLMAFGNCAGLSFIPRAACDFCVPTTDTGAVASIDENDPEIALLPVDGDPETMAV